MTNPFSKPVESLEQLLAAMVQTPSVTAAVSGDPRSEQRLCESLDAMLQRWGLATQRLDVPQRGDQLLVTFAPNSNPDAPWLLFESHLDTVTDQGMSIDPFGGTIEDGKLYGRGACDTKASGAAMLWALREVCLQLDAAELANNIAVLLSIDEEAGMHGIRHFVSRDLPMLPWRERIVGVVVGEPTQLQPVVAHQGDVRFEITTFGKPAHSSTPWHGRSAISDMMHLLSEIESRYIPGLDAKDDLTGQAACSVNVIRGGSVVNVVPETCRIEVDRRLAATEELEQVSQQFATFVSEAASKKSGLNYGMATFFQAPPLRVSPAQTKWLVHVQAALQQHDMNPEALGMPYATHAGDLAEAGLPAIVIGPGNIAQAHQADEHVELEQVHQAARLYQSLMSG